MARGKSSDRRGSGPMWFVLLAVVVFILYSALVAMSQNDRCDGGPRHWTVFPPGWECEARPGLG